MNHSRGKTVVGAWVLAILLAQASFAGDHLMGEPESYAKTASMKLWRGVVNTVTGIGEIIRQPIVCTLEDGCVGVPVGLINGVFMACVRTGAGIVEVVTFPVPIDDKVGFDSLLNPDYVWQRAD